MEAGWGERNFSNSSRMVGVEIKELSAPVGEFYRHISESCTMFFSRGFEEQEWVSLNHAPLRGRGLGQMWRSINLR